MAFELLGDLDGGPSLDLDHERFAYAGKFVTGRTAKAVVREGGSVVAAASVDRDRTDRGTARVRYVTVREDRRGEGLGARLLAAVAEALSAEVDRVLIAVNNPYAYEAAYKAGFGSTGEVTGVAEVVLARPGDRSTAAYREGFALLAERGDLREAEAAFVASRRDGEPPSVVDPATGV